MPDSHYLGIDLGSSYTKLVVLNEQGEELRRMVMPTRTRRKEALEKALVELEQSTISAAVVVPVMAATALNLICRRQSSYALPWAFHPSIPRARESSILVERISRSSVAVHRGKSKIFT